MSSENTRRKALQIIQNEGVKQISPESFLVKSPSGSEYEVNVKTNEEENKDGKKEGEYSWYYENGQLKEKSNMKDGKWEGEYIEYYEKGQLKFKRNYKFSNDIWYT